MTTLVDHLTSWTNVVLSGELGLDEALTALEQWLDAHQDQISEEERKAFSAALEQESTNDNRSLVDSILKLHTARLFHRYNLQRNPFVPDADQSEYAQARARFEIALRHSEEIISEARIDVAIANAHNLLGNINANRRWLDAALDRLPDLAAVDLVAMARKIPPMDPPSINRVKRLGLRLIGFNFDRLAQYNRDSLAAIGHMQNNQIVILAHLLGTSFEASNERQRAKRAFRIAAHLITRQDGLPGENVEHLLSIAESIQPFEREAAHILADQAEALYADDSGPEISERIQALLR